MNHRGFTTIDPDGPELSPAVRARATALMNEWSELHHEEEQEGWRRQAAREDGDDYDPRICDCGEGADPDGLCVHDRKALTDAAETERARLAGRRLKMELIEAELESHGLRKMRPYEHWNEDESYMQHMEEGRFGHYSE